MLTAFLFDNEIKKDSGSVARNALALRLIRSVSRRHTHRAEPEHF
jgi:hypothetical protein